MKDILDKDQAKVFSSNFQLYSDFSKRALTLLETHCPKVELYSVDEALF